MSHRSTLHLLRISFCLIWLGCVDTRLMAQDLFALSLEELMMVTVEVASRQSEPLQHTPAAVTVFFLENTGHMDVRLNLFDTQCYTVSDNAALGCANGYESHLNIVVNFF